MPGEVKRGSLRSWPFSTFAFAACLLAGMVQLLPAGEADTVDRGRRLFASNCAICHGDIGDGRGRAAHMLAEQPRDFRTGLYKFRSTPTGSLPTDADLLHTLTYGVRWTGMVGRPDLPEADRRALVAFLKTLSPRFAAELPGKPIPISPAPPTTPSLIREGGDLYKDAGCDECHGPAGRGDGPAARRQHDAWGNPTQPSDLTWRPLKRGADPQGVYETIMSGLDGSPMPAHADVLDAGKAWALVAFLDTLVPADHRLPFSALLGEERMGWMILRMHGGGMGMPRGRGRP